MLSGKVSVQTWLDSALVVLVLYERKLDESQTYLSLDEALRQMNCTASLFAYDNSLNAQVCQSNSVWNITYTHDAANPGVSKAYNEGFKKAKDLNKKWLLLADQDTIFQSDFFEKLVEDISKRPSAQLLAPIVRNESVFISPFRFAFGRGEVLNKVQPQCYSLTRVRLINSGLIISMNLFEAAEGFDERFPLDFSDLVFHQRISQRCADVLIINSVCIQKLSSDEKSFDQMIKRFPYYLSGSKLFGELNGSKFFLAMNRLLRAIKLSFRFRSFEFLKILMQS